MSPEKRWDQQRTLFRDPAQIVSHWADADKVDPALLEVEAHGPFWELLEQHKIRLLVTREYEHLVVCLSAGARQTYLPLPHPSGIAVDLPRKTVHIASTRNPNQRIELKTAGPPLPRSDIPSDPLTRPLIPSATVFHPGSLYLHDLAMVGSDLFGNATGHNAVVGFSHDGHRYAWWPNCVDQEGAPRADRNYIQLNSIAAGPTLGESFFSATTDRLEQLHIGDVDFPVDGRGVIFSGRTREPIATGLTRPHSARLYGDLYVANSGYGELCVIRGSKPETVANLAGWTRGLACHQNLGFVGTSRILPRFTSYAPGVDSANARCGVHAVDLKTGQLLASIEWPVGNQIFAIEAIPESFADGFPFSTGSDDAREKLNRLFYAYDFGA